MRTNGKLLWVVLATVLGVAFCASKLAEPLDLRLLDAAFALMRRDAPAAADVVIVGIDEATAASIPEPLALWHRHWGRFLEAVAASGARALVVDVVLPDRSYDGIAKGYDQALLEGIVAMRTAAPLVLALTVDETGETRRVHAPFLSAAGEGAAAYALWRVDPDGTVRRFDERMGQDGAS